VTALLLRPEVAFADWTQPDGRGIGILVHVIHDPVSVAVRDGLIRGQRPIEVVRSTTRDVPARVREDRVLDARHRTVSTRPPLNARDSSAQEMLRAGAGMSVGSRCRRPPVLAKRLPLLGEPRRSRE
jgi:hypothetical protein